MKLVRRVSAFEFPRTKSGCKIRSTSSLVVLLALLFWYPIHLVAQTETATISGQVTDASQAPVPNAPVVIRNEQTAQEFSVKTGENGKLRFASAAAGFLHRQRRAPGLQKGNSIRLSRHRPESAARFPHGTRLRLGIRHS